MIKKILFVLLTIVLFQNTAFAQDKTDQRTITTRIADLLAQLPARDAKQLKENMQEIARMGEDGYVTMISGLTAPGKGNNSLLEYAIGGFSAYVTQNGQENGRKMSVGAYCKSLQKLSDSQNKSFIISQLELVGKDDAVSCLQDFLRDDKLADPAARALVKINTSASKNALLNALGQAGGDARLAIIEALGDSRFKEAARVINALATDSDQNVAKASLYALAHIADPSSESILAAAAEKNAFKYENTNSVSSYITYAEQLLRDGNQSLAEKIGEKLLLKTASDELADVRTSALKIVTDADKENNTRYLLDAAGDKNAEYRAAALKFAVPYITPATTRLWVKKIRKSDDATKAAIVSMLGESSAKDALPAILKLLKSKNPEVKLAAVEAAAIIGQEQVLADLLKLMSKGDTAEISAVSNAILSMKGIDIPGKLQPVLPYMKPQVQVALINILASRAANAQLGAIYKFLKNENPEVRQAAYAALSKMVTRENLPQLFILLNETSGAEALQVQSAIIAAMRGAKENSQQADMVMQQMASAPEDRKALFYKILANLGGDKSLKAVSSAYNTGNEETRKAALDALTSWADAGSADELIKISRQTNNPQYRDQALNGYLHLVRGMAYPAEQKLLLLREAMAVAKTPAQQQQILKDITQVKTFNSLVFAGKYLNNPDLQQVAANAVMNIALSDKSYSGDIVKNLLNKTMEVISGRDSEYQKEAIRKYIAEMPQGVGFVSVFNGQDLTGWKGLVGDPIKRSKMDVKTLAAEQERADTEMRESWKVVNGELQFTGHGNNLATIKKYGDFEMLVDWKIIDDKKQEGDAGIYLRGTPQVQIWDNARVKVGAQVGSGGLYNNKVNESKPLKVADNKLDEWNTFRILMKGDRVTVYLNGELVTDNVILENFWDRSLPIFPEEQIELQAHGSPVSYRDIYIREIPRVKPFELNAQEKKEGFKVLFDGTNMHNWTGNTTDYIIEDGNIAIRPKPGKGSGGNLFTKEEYSDFVFRFEFQLTPGANNGLGIRAPLKGDAAYEGMELQILDNEAPIYKNLHVYQYHGSVYGTIPAKRGFLKPVGEWNYEEVIVKGPKIKVILNGTAILDADITDARKNGAADGKKHPGLLRDSGHIGFLGHGSPVQFRNIRIRDLSK